MTFSSKDWPPIDHGLLHDGVAALGWFTASDASVLFECDQDAEHRKRFELPADRVPSMEHARAVISSWEHGRSEGQRCVFVVRTMSGEAVGGGEVSPRDARVANLSYWTCPASRGKGFAQRGLRLMCAWVDTLEYFDTLEVLVDPDNGASRRVAMACGFEPVGMRDGRILHVKRVSPEGLEPNPPHHEAG